MGESLGKHRCDAPPAAREIREQGYERACGAELQRFGAYPEQRVGEAVDLDGVAPDDLVGVDYPGVDP